MKKNQSLNGTVRKSLVALVCCALSACATNQTKNPIKVDSSFLEQARVSANVDGTEVKVTEREATSTNFERILGMKTSTNLSSSGADLASQFSEVENFQVSSDELPLKEWLHYILGEVLKVNYILDEAAKNDNKTLTLSIRDKVSLKRLFVLTEELLAENGYMIRFKEDIFYVTKVNPREQSGEVVYGFGKRIEDVPQTSREIFQIVPLEFSIRQNYNSVLNKLSQAQLIPDFQQGIYYLRGKRDDIINALEFLNIVDTPYYQSRHIGIAEFVFLSPEQFLLDVGALLENEGISVGSGTNKGKSAVFVPLDHLGAVAVFASSELVLNRINYWAKRLDKPSKGGSGQYFVFQPELARATDLMGSLAPLVSDNFSTPGVEPSPQPVDSGGNTSQGNKKITTAGNAELKIVVDERSNTLIIFATGEKYQQLLPLMRRLDVMPKQVILEVTIAEVTLRDDFKRGVEFALSKGNYSLSTNGAFGVDKIGGLSYMLTGTSGNISAQFFEDNNLVNILSRPSIVVRDGVQASISVGNDIPVVGAIITDPVNGSSQSIQYRKTGVSLDVTPTINSQGVIIMEIAQEISNTVDGGSTVEGAPAIFERTISTEVVADSGQTVILGGLISENKTLSKSKVPGLGDLPVIGGLFSSMGDNVDKTELVVLVTPRIIENREQWKQIKSDFNEKITQFEF